MQKSAELDRFYDVLTGFSGAQINRMAPWRDDPAALERAQTSEHALCLVLAEDRPVLVRRDQAWSCHLPMPAAQKLSAASGGTLVGPVFLGLMTAHTPLFALSLRATTGDDELIQLSAHVSATRLGGGGHDDIGDIVMTDLRPLADHAFLPRADLAHLSAAKSLLSWHSRHLFCAQCGGHTENAQGGWRRDCGGCGASHFPRTDPVVIMLAYDGERCLMGRQPRFPAGMYSALAGFIEPGETIEEAVRREVMEEAGIEIGRVDYVASQPWPYPSSLMIGCFAQARSTSIRIDHTELEDARWFSRQEIATILAGTHDHIISPRPTALAHTLMRLWCAR
jgi:NAD+ diphosphatase